MFTLAEDALSLFLRHAREASIQRLDLDSFGLPGKWIAVDVWIDLEKQRDIWMPKAGDSDRVFDFIARRIVGWNLVDDAGVILPITSDTVRVLDIGIMLALVSVFLSATVGTES